MVNYCCVNGCNRNSRLNKHLNYYSFPKERTRQKQWLRLVGREDLIDKGELKSGYRVCSRHFAPNSLKSQSINLNPDALPTLCLPSDGVEEDDPEPLRHNGIVCNNCKKSILGFRYKCVSCDDYDLCAKCESMETHSHHYMLRIPRPLKFMIADQLIKKLSALFKAEHVTPDFQSDASELESISPDDSDDDEPITKYARSSDSGVDLSEDVKTSIREEVARALAASATKKKKRHAAKRSGSDVGNSSKRLRSSSLDPEPHPPPAPVEVAFADVNEICDVKSETAVISVASSITGTEFEQPLMHMRLSDDLTELMIEISGEPSKTIYKY